MNESYHSSRTTQKPKKVPLVKSIVARAKNRTPWTVQACVEACACDRTPDTTRTAKTSFDIYFLFSASKLKRNDFRPKFMKNSIV